MNPSACRITAITSAFQADDVSSILTTRLFLSKGVFTMRDLFTTALCYVTGVALVAAFFAMPFFIRDDV